MQSLIEQNCPYGLGSQDADVWLPASSELVQVVEWYYNVLLRGQTAGSQPRDGQLCEFGEAVVTVANKFWQDFAFSAWNRAHISSTLKVLISLQDHYLHA